MGVGFEAIAPGKLLLFGEHAAVYGYPALGMALPVRLNLRIDFEELPEAPHVAHHGAADIRDTRESIEDRWDLPRILDDQPHLLSDFFLTVEQTAAQLLPTLEIERYRGVVSLSSEIPIASGFGSSAAVCACVSRILLAAESSGDISDHTSRKRRPSKAGESVLTAHETHFMPTASHPQRLWSLANTLERFFHGTPSGIDTGLAVLGGTQAFFFPRDRGADTLPEAYPRAAFPGWLVAGSVPRHGSTKELVASVREQVDREQSAMKKLEELGEIALEVAELLEGRRNAETVIRTADRAERAHLLLRELGLSHSSIEAALEAGKGAGALGGKLSGAGGGGAFYLVCRDQAEAKRVFDAIAALLDPEGLVVIPPQQVTD